MKTPPKTARSRTDRPEPAGASPALPAACLLPVDALVPREENRNLAQDAELDELADSLRVVGQLNPIHVQPMADGKYEIVAGVRRWLATKRNGMPAIRAIVHERCTAATADQIRFIENAHRRDPTAFDTARALRRIKNLGGFTHAEVASHTAISLARVKQYLGLFSASDALLQAVEAHALPISIAVELVRYEKACGELASRKVLKRVIAADMSVRELATLRKRAVSAKPVKSRGDKGPSDPWAVVEARIKRLVASDPKTARPKMEALAAALGRMLEKGAA